jgi:hypothetical protein
MPLLILIMPAREAVALSLLTGVVLNLMTIRDERSGIAWREIGLLMPASIAGIAAGALLLKSLDGPWFKIFLSLSFLAMAVVMLASRSLKVKPGTALNQIVGALSGLLMGSTSMGGPPIVLYFAGRGMNRAALKGTLAAFFLLGNLIALGALLAGRILEAGAATPALIMTLAMVPGYLAGRWLTARLNPTAFRRLVLVTIAAAGVLEASLGAAALA